MPKFDPTDRALLQMIQENARLTIKEMAKQLHLSTTPIFERLKRFEKQGLIERYVALLNPMLVGKNLTVFVHISVQDHRRPALDEFSEHVAAFPEVTECFHVSGDADFILKVLVRDMAAYNTFVIEKLSTAPNVGKVTSTFVLSRRKWTTALAIEEAT